MTNEKRGDETQPKVFISYSRDDFETAERIRDMLTSTRFEAYLDKHDILPGERWEERLSELIEMADSVVFLLSPRSVASKVCNWEVNEAERLEKRVLPVVIEDSPADSVPGRLKRLNYIFMRTAREKAEGLVQLERALLTDIAWVREHTRIGGLAARWLARDCTTALALRGKELEAAERWIAARTPDASESSELQRHFVTESRRAATRRQRTWIAISAGVAIVSLGLAALAELNRREAQARELAARSDVQRASAPQTALALASCAVGISDVQQAGEALMASHRAMLGVARVLPPAGSGVSDAAVTPQGEVLVVVYETGKARIWDLAKPRAPVREFHLADDVLTSVAVSPSGTQAFVGTRTGVVHLLDIGTGSEAAKPLKVHKSTVSALLATSETTAIAAANDNTLAHIDMNKSRVLCRPQTKHRRGLFRTGIRALARLTPTNTIVSAGSDGTLVSWELSDVDDCRPLSTWQPEDKSTVAPAVWSLAQIPDGTGLMVGDGDGKVSFLIPREDGRLELDERHGEELIDRSDLTAYSVAAKQGTNSMAVARSDRSVSFWSAAAEGALDSNAIPVFSALAHGRDVIKVLALPDDRFLSIGLDGAALLWDRQSVKNLLRQVRPIAGVETGGQFSQSGRFALMWNEDGLVVVYDLQQAKITSRIANAVEPRILVGAVSDDGGLIALGDESGTLSVLRTSDGVRLADADSPGKAGIDTLIWRPGSRVELMSGDYSGYAVRWLLDVESRLAAEVIDRHPSSVSAVAYSANGRWMASTPTTGPVVVHANGHNAIRQTFAVGETDAVTAIALDLAGTRVAIATSDTGVTVYDRATGQPRHRLQGHSDTVDALTFDPGSRHLASGGRDRRVIVWEGATRVMLLPEADLGWPRELLFSEAGNSLVLIGENSVLSQWSIDHSNWIAHTGEVLPTDWRYACSDNSRRSVQTAEKKNRKVKAHEPGT